MKLLEASLLVLGGLGVGVGIGIVVSWIVFSADFPDRKPASQSAVTRMELGLCKYLLTECEDRVEICERGI